MLIKKLLIAIGLMILLFCTAFSGLVEASNKVSDCLDGNTECEDELEPTPTNESETEQDESTGGTENNGLLLFDLVKMFFALLLVLALIYLLIKFLGKRNKLFHQVKALENLGGISVGQNKSIQLVRIGTKVYLIGVGENVEMLQEITDDEIKKDLLHIESNEDKDFSAGALFKSFLQPKSDGDSYEANQSKHEFKQLFSNELEKLKTNRKNIIKWQNQKEDKHE
ncbi:flagellar biosynthetic protein FliO [Virgibacillus sp. NKC19-16]|uniref:flagellar biosynthetic protein FliO n=1 Tax=Virgibacillus salidurans TaxID=2831673 RepID=UPI001F1888F1|nr:flagellar biosynthetic protein FliO [Virgibacillus sp. NKC19-16]UJL47949.1 flagellar biosynthetic protein FliO [Virgibacillus sp. NKC19-16]